MKRYSQILINIFVVAMVVLIIFSCQRGVKSDKSIPTVAFVMKTLNNPYFIEMQRGAEDVAKKYGEFKESVRGKSDEFEEFVP